MFHLADTPPKVGNIHRAISFVYSCISSIQFTSEIQLFGLRIAVNAMFLSSLFSKQPRFQSNIPSISLALFQSNIPSNRRHMAQPGSWYVCFSAFFALLTNL